MDQLQTIYETYFDGHMDKLVVHGIGNFCVQKLLDAWQDKESFESLSQSIKGNINEIMNVRHTGVLLAWTKACARIGSQQGKCIVALMSLFSCYEPQERQLKIVPALLHLLTYEDLQEKKDCKMNLHGSLIIQNLLSFKKPIRIIESLLNINTAQLVKVMSDLYGSHIINSYCKSPHVGEKNKLKLMQSVVSEVATLAKSKHGAHSLISLWNAVPATSHAGLCQTIADNHKLIKSSEFGFLILNRLNVSSFMDASDKTEWMKNEEGKSKKRKLLEDTMKFGQKVGSHSLAEDVRDICE